MHSVTSCKQAWNKKQPGWLLSSGRRLLLFGLQNSEEFWLLVLQDNAFNYDKGVLAEILEPIMGKGLIPADLETWKPRRRAIVPAFHKAYLQAMIGMFGRCTEVAVQKLDAIASSGQVQPLTY